VVGIRGVPVQRVGDAPFGTSKATTNVRYGAIFVCVTTMSLIGPFVQTTT
jgi:hypothetical protein